MFNVRQAVDHLYGNLLFTWLSVLKSWMVSFCAILFTTRAAVVEWLEQVGYSAESRRIA